MNYAEINFSRDNLEIFTKNNKLYSYLYNNLSRAYFKIEPKKLHLYLKGADGLFRQQFSIEYNGTSIYFSLDFSKWVNALAKFSYADNIKLEISNKQNHIRISTEDSPDVINLSIQKYKDDSSDVVTLTHNLPNTRKAIKSENLLLELNDDVIGDLNLAGSLFVTQGNVNSIGLGKTGVIYADRATILRTEFLEFLPESLFTGNTDDGYIYIHQYILGLLGILYKENPHVYFSNDYSIIYWESDDKELMYTSPYRELAIPTDSQLESLVPQNTDSSFDVDIETLKNSLDFFNGFYEGSVWKPITFNCVANKETVMRYKHPSADITKALPNTSAYDGTFILDSESIKKILSKIRDKREDKKEPLNVIFNFDNDSPGILCTIGNYCNVIFAKLEDDSEI